jgi:hypothetical protein
VVDLPFDGGFEKEDCEDGVSIEVLTIDDVLDGGARFGVVAGEEPDPAGGRVGPAGCCDVFVGWGVRLTDVVAREMGREVWDGGV